MLSIKWSLATPADDKTITLSSWQPRCFTVLRRFLGFNSSLAFFQTFTFPYDPKILYLLSSINKFILVVNIILPVVKILIFMLFQKVHWFCWRMVFSFNWFWWFFLATLPWNPFLFECHSFGALIFWSTLIILNSDLDRYQ